MDSPNVFSRFNQSSQSPMKRHRGEARRDAAAPQPTFGHLLDTIAAQAANGHVGDARDITFRDIVAAVGSRSYGALLLILGAVSISPLTILPGANWFVAAITLLVSLQMTFSAQHLWLPRQVLDVRLQRASIKATVTRLRPIARLFDMLLKPRLTPLARAPWMNAAGLVSAAAALATFPLGLVPLGPVAPGVAITMIGLGLFFKDGLIVLIGLATVAAALGGLIHLFT